MKLYLVSLGAGVLVGIIYSLLNVRSPPPPVVALIGLFGILVGEQIVPLGKQMLAGHPFSAAWLHSHCTQHVFGQMPGRDANIATMAGTAAESTEKLS